MEQQFISASTHFLHWNLERIERCLAELTEEEVWHRPGERSNSVAIQLLHLTGNIRQWIMSGIAGQPDGRQRAAEFAPSSVRQRKAQLLAALKQTVAAAVAAIENSTAATLAVERPVQAYVHDGVFIVLHVVEHMSYHTGQIIFWTKQLRDKDLQFYVGDDLDRTN